MSVKDHLKAICSYERLIHEGKLKLSKMEQAKKDAEQSASQENEKLQSDVDKKVIEMYNVEQDIKKYRSRSLPNANFEICVSIVALVVVIIYQLFARFLAVDIFGASSSEEGTLNLAIIYVVSATIIFLVLRFGFGFEWGAFFGCLISCVVLIWSTSIYLNSKVIAGSSVNDAIISANVIFDIFLIILAAMYCWTGYKASETYYYDGQDQIKKSKKVLEAKEVELTNLKKKRSDYEKSSKKSLDNMQSDINKQIQHINDLKTKLANLYAQNIIHPNYHNWVAAATIYEYLDVGRCSELRGYTGAYNLYEQELIAKKILDSLSAINSSITYYGSTISQSQQYIRHQLIECNRNVEQLVVNKYGL